jgi:hypothetical protein
MRSYLLRLTALLLFASASPAQNAMPTKEETVNYIHKKLQDLVGKVEKSSGGASKFVSFSFELKGAEIEYVVRETTYNGRTTNSKTLQVFNPAHINAGDEAVYECGVGESICVRFPEKLAKKTETRGATSYAPTEHDAAIIEYDPKIPEMKNRMMKALRHLRDLAKAEDDPFSN